MAAPAYLQTAVKTGQRKTINLPRNFTTSLWTTRSPITFTARNRTTQMLASPVARIGARSGGRIGSKQAAANAALSCRTRAIGASYIQTTEASLIARIRLQQKCKQ